LAKHGGGQDKTTEALQLPAVPGTSATTHNERTFLRPMAEELDAWLKSGPWGVDLEESPSGWHKHFGSFTILCEAECIKTVFTIYAPGNPRPHSVDLDEWEKRGVFRPAALDAAVHVLPRPPLVILP
jgi:hypothetical protein